MAFLSQQMSAPLQRRAPSRLPLLHAARIAETLHQLRLFLEPTGSPALQGARRKAAQRAQVFTGCFLGEEIALQILQLWVPPTSSEMLAGGKGKGSSGDSRQCFFSPKDKPELICFTQPGFCAMAPGAPQRLFTHTPPPSMSWTQSIS